MTFYNHQILFVFRQLTDFPEKWCKSLKGFLLQFRIPGFEKKILRQRNDAAEFGGTQFVIDKTTPGLLHVFFEPFTVFWLGG